MKTFLLIFLMGTSVMHADDQKPVLPTMNDKGEALMVQINLIGQWSCVETNHISFREKGYTYTTTKHFDFSTNGFVMIVEHNEHPVQDPVRLLNTKYLGSYNVASNSMNVSCSERSGYRMEVGDLLASFNFAIDGQTLYLTNNRSGQSSVLTHLSATNQLELELFIGETGEREAHQYAFTTNNNTLTLTGWNGYGKILIIPARVGGLPVTTIAKRAFRLYNHPCYVQIPDTVTIIEREAFRDSLRMTNIIIGANVAKIDEAAFLFCKDLTNINIPNSVTNIGFSAFAFCSGLEMITIGSGLKTIGKWAFSGCKSLTNVHFQGNAPSILENGFADATNAIIFYNAGTTGWGEIFGGRPTSAWKP